MENRIEWCFQPIQVFNHQFISSTNTGRLFLLSGLNEVSCRCDLKRRVEENEGKAGSRKVEEKIIPDIQKRIANKLQFPLEGCVCVCLCVNKQQMDGVQACRNTCFNNHQPCLLLFESMELLELLPYSDDAVP